MPFEIRTSGAESTRSEVTRLQAIEHAVPVDTVDDVLARHGCVERRDRKLSARQIVYLLIVMSLFGRKRLSMVLEHLLHTWQLLFEEHSQKTPGDGAIHYRRDQLGVEPMVDLFHKVCQPLATETTQGAFLFGLRKMAIDGKQFNLFDNPQLDRYFGRPETDRGRAAFPQARVVTLQEIGTHAIVDAGVWPIRVGEQTGAHRLLRSVEEGMLVLFDRGLYAFALILGILNRGAHVLCRVPAGVKPQFESRLPDGTQLVRIAAAAHHPHPKGTGLLVRLIRYTIRDADKPEGGEEYRLVTTLLDPELYPGKELALAYHERWEIELGYDEMEIHLLQGDAPLRSRRVLGVLQEIYSLLISHYAIRAVMHEAAVEAHIDPDTISFIDTVDLVQEAIHDFQMTAPCLHQWLWQRLLTQIAEHQVQQRPPRQYPRVVRRKMSNFRLRRQDTKKGRNVMAYELAVALI